MDGIVIKSPWANEKKKPPRHKAQFASLVPSVKGGLRVHRCVFDRGEGPKEKTKFPLHTKDKKTRSSSLSIFPYAPLTPLYAFMLVTIEQYCLPSPLQRQQKHPCP